MDFNDLQILPPSNWEKFEDLCLDIFRAQWRDPYATKNGRRGQPQHGTDISGNPQHAAGHLHGVQCKGKDVLYGAAVTETELEAEVEKALKFEPPLDCWLLVTTASKDASIEAIARRITARHALKGLFSVRVFGWEDLRTRIADSDEVMTKHYPDQAPRQREILEKLGAIESDVTRGNVATTAAVAEILRGQIEMTEKLGAFSVLLLDPRRPTTGQGDASETVLHARIDDLRTLLQENQPKTALRRLERLAFECWDGASNFARFRLLANKAAALFNLGRNDDAAHACLEALPFAPSDARAIVYASQGHFLLGDTDKSRSMLDELLSREPNNDDALAMRIAISIDEDAVRNPYWKAVDPTTVGWNVVLSAARWYRHRGMHEEGAAAFRRVLSVQPDNLEVMAETASYTLEILFRNKAAIFAHKLDLSQMDALCSAIDLLAKVWNGVKHSEIRDNYLWSLLNMCNALCYVGRDDDAKACIDEAVSFTPHDRSLLKRKALLEAATGQHEQLLRTLDVIGSSDPEACLMRSDALEALRRPVEALAALDGVIEASSLRLRVAAAGSRVRLLVSLGRDSEALSTASETASTFSDNALARLVISDFYRYMSRPEDALREAGAAVGILKDHASEDGLDALVVAETLSKLRDWEGAADLLADVGAVRHDSAPLRLRVHALLNSGRRQELRRLLDDMPQEVIESPPYSRVAAWLFRLSGDYPQARSYLDIYIRQVPDDLSMRLLWLDVVERQDDKPAIQSFFSGELPDLKPSSGTRDLMALAQALARHGFPERGLDLGYRVLRERWSEATAHLGFCGLIMMVDEVRGAIPSPTSIAPGVAFTVEDDLGHRRIYIVEAAPNPKVELNEITPDSRLAKAALSLKTGDTIRVNDNDLVPKQRIVELAHKYLSLFHRSLREFSTLFPDNNSLIGMNVDQADPGRFLAQVAPALAARSAAGREMLEQYRGGSLPIAFAGRMIGLDPVEAWQAIRGGGMNIDVCLGVQPERDRAAGLLRDRPPLILDPMTFWIAGILGLLDAFASTFGKLGMAATGFELLAERERSASDHLARGRGVMFERDGNIGFVEPTMEEKRAPAELASRLLAWARANAVVVPAIPDRDMTPDVRRLGEQAHPSIMDTIAAASGSGRVLLCEDRRLRQLSGEVGVPKSIWLQPAISVCLSTGSLSRKGYDDILLDLALLGHSFTSLDGQTLLRATTRWGANSPAFFQRIAGTLALPTLETNSLRKVCLEFVQRLWRQPRAMGTKESLTAILLASCRQAHQETPAVLCALLEHTLKKQRAVIAESDARQLAHALRYIREWSIANPIGTTKHPDNV